MTGDNKMSKYHCKDAFIVVFCVLFIGIWCGYSLMRVYPIGTPIETFHLRNLFIMLFKKNVSFNKILQKQGAVLEDVRCSYIPVNRFGISIYINGNVDVFEIKHKLWGIISQDMNNYFPQKYQYTIDIYTCTKITNDLAIDTAEKRYLSAYNEPIDRVLFSAPVTYRLLIGLKQLSIELSVLFIALVFFVFGNRFKPQDKGLKMLLKRHILLCFIFLNIGSMIGINTFHKCGVIRSQEADSIQKLICFLIKNDETVKASSQEYGIKVIEVSSSFSPKNTFNFKIYVTGCIDTVDTISFLSTVRTALHSNIDYFFLRRYELFFTVNNAIVNGA